MCAYASASDVAALTPNLLGILDAYGPSSSPTLQEVEEFLSSGCAIIETHLTAWGYVVPITPDLSVYGWLGRLNVYFAAAMAEISRTVATVGPDERTRGQVFDEWFWRDLERLGEVDLTLMGAARTTHATIYSGAQTVTDKDSYESDTDRVKPRFARGMFDTPGTVRSSGQGSAS